MMKRLSLKIVVQQSRGACRGGDQLPAAPAHFILPKYYLTISQFTMILKNGSFQFDLFCEHSKKLVVCGGAMLQRS